MKLTVTQISKTSTAEKDRIQEELLNKINTPTLDKSRKWYKYNIEGIDVPLFAEEESVDLEIEPILDSALAITLAKFKGHIPIGRFGFGGDYNDYVALLMKHVELNYECSSDAIKNLSGEDYRKLKGECRVIILREYLADLLLGDKYKEVLLYILCSNISGT